jgi:hypothetical protein
MGKEKKREKGRERGLTRPKKHLYWLVIPPGTMPSSFVPKNMYRFNNPYK